MMMEEGLGHSLASCPRPLYLKHISPRHWLMPHPLPTFPLLFPQLHPCQPCPAEIPPWLLLLFDSEALLAPPDCPLEFTDPPPLAESS